MNHGVLGTRSWRNPSYKAGFLLDPTGELCSRAMGSMAGSERDQASSKTSQKLCQGDIAKWVCVTTAARVSGSRYLTTLLTSLTKIIPVCPEYSLWLSSCVLLWPTLFKLHFHVPSGQMFFFPHCMKSGNCGAQFSQSCCCSLCHLGIQSN